MDRDSRGEQKGITKCDKLVDFKVKQKLVTKCDECWIKKCEKMD